MLGKYGSANYLLEIATKLVLTADKTTGATRQLLLPLCAAPHTPVLSSAVLCQNGFEHMHSHAFKPAPLKLLLVKDAYTVQGIYILF